MAFDLKFSDLTRSVVSMVYNACMHNSPLCKQTSEADPGPH